MPRKTVKIEKIIEMGNKVLMNDTHDPEFRSGVKLMLENILHESGTYRGFRFLTQEEVPQGEAPGIHYEDGLPAPYPERFENTDSTRVKFF
jgi:hypothetical protein